MSASTSFRPGQRWISASEPELGMGSVLRVTARTVLVGFKAANEQREYARDNAPLRRVRFRAGDFIKNKHGGVQVVRGVTERDGILCYLAEGQPCSETDLCETMSFSKPEERLFACQVDPSEVFDLRTTALRQQYQRRKSAVRGFLGGRIDLIPHQLYVASEVTGRLVPRVLLADEVGLGKTIEACLILHRLLLTGRVHRVLILVPESLVHQWFVELLRRFNLWFHIFDEERCDSIESANPEANPFLDDQLVVSSLSFFTGNERRTQQALSAGWDLLVVDEAHHLGWSEAGASKEYEVVEALGRRAPSLLLLTATPEQLGMTSHFARLRLLDPERFYELGQFIKEAESYQDVARLAEQLLAQHPFASTDIARLAGLLAETNAEVNSRLGKIAQGDADARARLLDALLDRHGTGRVMFRNTRATIAGFPGRTAHLYSLASDTGQSDLFETLSDEFAADTDSTWKKLLRQSKDCGSGEDAVASPALNPLRPGSSGTRPSLPSPDCSKDPRVVWLAGLIADLAPEKILLLCRTQAKVEAIEAALRKHLNVKIAVFHEGLPLVKRDRNAAWFAEEDGARLLVCSEIGSEGRNFQFAHHLVLFDLPLDPELLEQRIGRLDRIGQAARIQVHVPFVTGSSQEVLARWYHEGLNAFECNLHGGRQLLEQFGEGLRDLAQDFHETVQTSRPELDWLIQETQTARKELAAQLERGRDRLLELNSFRPKEGARIAEQIRRPDQDESLDTFMLAIFDHYSIHVEELSRRTYRLGSAGVFADSFPGLPAEGLAITCERERALVREDIQFLTWDHPLVTGALDLLLGSEQGNSSYAYWPDPKQAGLYLEAIYLLECIAPPQLHVDRFLPPTPVRVLVDHRGNESGAAITLEFLGRCLQNGDPYPLLEQPEIREDLLPGLLEQTQAIASFQIQPLVADARRAMHVQLSHEISRLTELQKVNRSVRAEEIELLFEQQRALDQHLADARLRLDAIRLIQRGPPSDSKASRPAKHR